MSQSPNLTRFLDAQQDSYETAVTEIRHGKKQSHWMWYTFPQIAGLGASETSKFYAIKDIDEAQAYLQHPVLGQRLHEIAGELLQLPTNDATAVFGKPDDMKLRSSMTLFASIAGAGPVFQSVLDKFFNGQKDSRTMTILGK
jgi:uncharacterized protein (DUF1810 family)